jgi:antitoxin component YwqK of YwqJK toxin-antitoxin module
MPKNEHQVINRLHLHYRKDGYLYKKHAKKPFSGIAEDFNIDGSLVTRMRIRNGKQDGLIEGFSSDGCPLFKGFMKSGEFDRYKGLEIFSQDGSFSISFLKNGALLERGYTSNHDLKCLPDNKRGWWKNLYENKSFILDPVKLIKSLTLLSH